MLREFVTRKPEPKEMLYPVPRSWFLISFFNKRNQSSLYKKQALRLEMGVDKISLELLVIPEVR